MIQQQLIRSYRDYLVVEKGLSMRTVEAYVGDITRFFNYAETCSSKLLSIEEFDQKLITAYLKELSDVGMQRSSQARILSSIKSFFDYMVIEEMLTANPAELLSAPKQRRKLPNVLSIAEIEAMIQGIDHSTAAGLRTRAMVEVLYASGLRVSELVSLRLSNINWKEEVVRVIGKGNKERIVPISPIALRHMGIYIEQARAQIKGSDKTVFIFLNHRANPLSRVSVFLAIKKLVADAQITKSISPHSLRHALATHLIEGGADLRSVQQILGHEHITTTEIYTHLDKRYLRDTLYAFHPMYQDRRFG